MLCFSGLFLPSRRSHQLTLVSISLAQFELWKVVAAFFRRFECTIDSSMMDEDMRPYDNFSAGPAGLRLLIHLKDTAAS